MTRQHTTNRPLHEATYRRVAAQPGTEQSLLAQAERIRAFIESSGWEVVPTYADTEPDER